eukprot:GHVN01095274.1.p1 GENE.GHVN01095274.1~~GHVN01095274.1.p1  ORF type:complete len:505 (-),score=60.50 GHVN01095274.1:304-1818(-)
MAMESQNFEPSFPGKKVDDADGLEIKLFVGRVPTTYDEAAIKTIFEEFGTVLEVAVNRDRSTGAHKGSAFVRMASLKAADAAMKALDNQRSLGQAMGPLNVRYAAGEAEKLGLPSTGAKDDPKLFVGSIPKASTEEEVKAVFLPFGMVKEVFLMKDGAGGSKGCAFVKFAFREQAMLAINKLNGVYQMEGAPRPLEVKFAESKRQMQGGDGMGMRGMGGMGMGMGGMGGMGMGGMGMGMGGYGMGGMGMGGMGMGGMGMGGMGGGMGAMGGMGMGAMGGGMGMPHGAGGAFMGMANNNPRQAGPWKEYFTPEGKCYYYNEKTGMSQWEGPPEFEQSGGNMAGPPGSNVAGTDTAGPPGANVFVVHMPNDWGYNEFISTFQPFGRIISSRLSYDYASQRNKGFGFISYDNVESAVQCVTQMNGMMICNKKLNVTIKKGEEQYVAHLFQGGSSGMGQSNSPMPPGIPDQQRAGGQLPPQPPSGQGQYGGGQFDGFRAPQSIRYSPY